MNEQWKESVTNRIYRLLVAIKNNDPQLIAVLTRQVYERLTDDPEVNHAIVEEFERYYSA